MATVKHLSHSHFDYCPVLVELAGRRMRSLGARPFRFQAACLLHTEFSKWMEEEWIREGDLMCSLRGLTKKLIAWNIDTFGCIFERKRRVKRRLEGVMKVLSERQSLGPIRLEKRLKNEWTEVLLQEELLWK